MGGAASLMIIITTTIIRCQYLVSSTGCEMARPGLESFAFVQTTDFLASCSFYAPSQPCGGAFALRSEHGLMSSKGRDSSAGRAPHL